MIKCLKCKELKVSSEFYNNPNTKSRKGSRCKECLRIPVKGFIYIITNPAWDGFIKIGRASNPKNRLNSYQTSSPLRDYEMNYKVFVNDLHIIEIHFKKKYSTDFGEWCNISVNEAVEQIEKTKELNKL